MAGSWVVVGGGERCSGWHRPQDARPAGNRFISAALGAWTPLDAGNIEVNESKAHSRGLNDTELCSLPGIPACVLCCKAEAIQGPQAQPLVRTLKGPESSTISNVAPPSCSEVREQPGLCSMWLGVYDSLHCPVQVTHQSPVQEPSEREVCGGQKGKLRETPAV